MKKIILTIFATFILSLSAFGQASDLLSAAAKAQFEKQNFAPCIAETSKIILAQPKNDAALVERARCLYLSADDTNDEKVILAEVSKKILDKNKAQTAADAEVMARRNKAIADATKAIALNPKNANAFNIRGLVRSSLGTKDRAESIADFGKAIELDPKFIKPYFNRGATKADMSDYDGAIADFAKVIELDPNNIAALEQRSSAFISKYNGGASIEGIDDLLKLSKLAPNNKNYYKIIESLCLNSPYPYGYADIFKQYIAINPNSADGYLGLARSQASVERYYDLDKKVEYWKTAENAYLKYIELNPTVIEPYIELFDLYLDKLSSRVNAKVMTFRTLAKFPNNPQSYMLSGKMAESNGDWATALKEFSRAIELNPNYSLAYERRSNAYAGLKEDDKAMSDLNKAIELDPNNGSAYLDRGNFYDKLKKYPQAIADFSEADKLKQTCAKTYRGIMLSTIAKENNEARNTGNFLNAQRDFLSDDAQKCYLTHFMYGLSLYSQGLNDQAAERFNYALTVYKKHGYDTAVVVEWQNRVKTATANTQVVTGSDTEQLIELYKQESLNQGATLVGSGIYDYSVAFDPAMKFNVSPGQTYVFIAIKDYDPTFGYDAIFNDRFIMRPTHRFDDNAYEIPAEAEYSMKVDNSKVRNLSVVRMNLYTTKKSPIRTIQFSQKGKVSKIHWLCFKLSR